MSKMLEESHKSKGNGKNRQILKKNFRGRNPTEIPQINCFLRKKKFPFAHLLSICLRQRRSYPITHKIFGCRSRKTSMRLLRTTMHAFRSWLKISTNFTSLFSAQRMVSSLRCSLLVRSYVCT